MQPASSPATAAAHAVHAGQAPQHRVHQRRLHGAADAGTEDARGAQKGRSLLALVVVLAVAAGSAALLLLLLVLVAVVLLLLLRVAVLLVAVAALLLMAVAALLLLRVAMAALLLMAMAARRLLLHECTGRAPAGDERRARYRLLGCSPCAVVASRSQRKVLQHRPSMAGKPHRRRSPAAALAPWQWPPQQEPPLSWRAGSRP